MTLESGKHADWHGFQPWFTAKVKDGEMLPPHADWVRNVLLRRRMHALREAERALDELC